jgi:uncharacterized cupredoxin-like copper-binding protein
MKKFIKPLTLGYVILGSTIMMTAYANDGHNNVDGHHNTRSDHHGEVGHHTMMNSKHETGMKGHHVMGHGDSLSGKPGKEGDVNRSIKVEAGDDMRFSHAPFSIKEGETIKFIVSNKGAIPHEFSIGTKDEHASHGKMMMANPNMHHGPGGASITIKPGTTETLIWSFESANEIEAACNIPGHYDAGMHSPIHIKGK